jgi:hypothetical protein
MSKRGSKRWCKKISLAAELLWKDPKYRRKVVLAHTGHGHSLASRKKIGLAIQERWKDLLYRADVVKKRRGKNHWAYGRHPSKSTRAKMAAAKLGKKRPPFSVEHCRRISEGLTGKIIPLKVRKKIAKTTSIKSKLLWKDPIYAQKVISSNGVRPNKKEWLLLGVLNRLFPDCFEYVGDGSFWISGKNPDFKRVDGKKQLIELNGDYWHKGENTRIRARHFAKYGYRTLFIWERELKRNNIVKLEKKLLRFVNA